MPISFSSVRVGTFWSKKTLPKKRGFKGYEALARGVLTAAGENNVVLFVKQPTTRSYGDQLVGRKLFWESPTDHLAEHRLVASRRTNEQMPLVCRSRHRMDFEYCGRIALPSHELSAMRSSRLVFELQEKGLRR